MASTLKKYKELAVAQQKALAAKSEEVVMLKNNLSEVLKAHQVAVSAEGQKFQGLDWDEL